jgi:menaquinone-specific isochorismate synthase
LAEQPFSTKVAWSPRDIDEVTVGIGEAATVNAEPGQAKESVLRRCRGIIGDHPDLRFFGGLSFDGNAAWPSFRSGRFVLPRFVLEKGVLQLVVLDHDDLATARAQLQDLCMNPRNLDCHLPAPISTELAPDENEWASIISGALDLVDHEVLEKIVLARQTTMVFANPLDGAALTSRIADTTHDCFVFCLQFDDLSFVGATPERLFRRTGSELCCDVIAGTRPRGRTTGEDQRLAYELLSSDKDQLEHEIVRKSIRQRLHKFVSRLEVDSHASVLRLARKQHLLSSVEGTLKAGVTDGDLLERLHPTPAVGGYPPENALPEIERLEPFNRGWYAAPLGWISRDEAEFVVAIRSGLIDGNQLKLYSGAGIVRGSQPESEWNEVENKIRDFVDVLGS